MSTSRSVWVALIPVAAALGCSSRQASTSAPTVTAATVPASQPRVSPPQPRTPATEIPTLPGSTVLGTAQVTQIRAFPEEFVGNKGRPVTAEAAIGVNGTDTLYQTDLPYSDAVSFFDDSLSRGGFTVTERTNGPGGTFWSVRSADGSPGRVAVRDSKPTTVEIIRAHAAAAESATPNH